MTNTENLERFADMIEPAYELLADGDLQEKWRNGKYPLYKLVPRAIKKHPDAVVQLLAAAEGVPVDEYVVPGPLGLAAKLMTLLKSEEVQGLFPRQGQESGSAASGSATESTEDRES